MCVQYSYNYLGVQNMIVECTPINVIQFVHDPFHSSKIADNWCTVYYYYAVVITNK
jgi:hypothetical protein